MTRLARDSQKLSASLNELHDELRSARVVEMRAIDALVDRIHKRLKPSQSVPLSTLHNLTDTEQARPDVCAPAVGCPRRETRLAFLGYSLSLTAGVKARIRVFISLALSG